MSQLNLFFLHEFVKYYGKVLLLEHRLRKHDGITQKLNHDNLKIIEDDNFHLLLATVELDYYFHKYSGFLLLWDFHLKSLYLCLLKTVSGKMFGSFFNLFFTTFQFPFLTKGTSWLNLNSFKG